MYTNDRPTNDSCPISPKTNNNHIARIKIVQSRRRYVNYNRNKEDRSRGPNQLKNTMESST